MSRRLAAVAGLLVVSAATAAAPARPEPPPAAGEAPPAPSGRTHTVRAGGNFLAALCAAWKDSQDVAACQGATR